MERFLGQEGWLFRFLDRLWDLIVLNVLFIITCIPLFTVGAAISALYTVTMKCNKNARIYCQRSGNYSRSVKNYYNTSGQSFWRCISECGEYSHHICNCYHSTCGGL